MVRLVLVLGLGDGASATWPMSGALLEVVLFKSAKRESLFFLFNMIDVPMTLWWDQAIVHISKPSTHALFVCTVPSGVIEQMCSKHNRLAA